MKERIKALGGLYARYREQITYIFFGGVTTLVNMAALEVFARLGCATWLANAAAWVISVLVAYFTNRRWVFRSRSRGAAALGEFAAFVGCRLGTFALDEGIMVAGVDLLGPALFPAGAPMLWRQAVKLFSNVLVIVLNYVLSKRLIFRKK